MLIHTLCHIPRISLKLERELWDQGIHSWEAYRSLARHPAYLDVCHNELKSQNARFFADALPTDQSWRLFADFQDQVAYVDIETTGLDKKNSLITTIALYDGEQLKTYVHGQNLDAFVQDIAAYKLLVTFNGKTFDVPFIKSFFGIDMPHAHIDLRYVLKRLGLSGGLKEIERRIGIQRGDLQNVDGYFAVRMWHEYQRRQNESALETLLAYNCTDVVNLQALMNLAFQRNLQQTPFDQELPLRPSTPVVIPYRVDRQLVERFA